MRGKRELASAAVARRRESLANRSEGLRCPAPPPRPLPHTTAGRVERSSPFCAFHAARSAVFDDFVHCLSLWSDSRSVSRCESARVTTQSSLAQTREATSISLWHSPRYKTLGLASKSASWMAALPVSQPSVLKMAGTPRSQPCTPTGWLRTRHASHP